VAIVALIIGGARGVDLYLDRNAVNDLEAARTAMAATPDGGVKVVVYSTQWCGVCKKAKAWLTKNDIPFEERDVETSRSAASEYRSLNPRGGVPTIDVEGDVMVGFSEGQLARMIAGAAKKHSGT